MRSRSGHFGSEGRKRSTSSYRTRRISISDMEEPTWPRPPPSSARTTRRRRSLERVSKTGETGTAIVVSARLGMCHLLGSVQKVARPGKLACLRHLPVLRLSGRDAKPPAIRQELVEKE